MMRKLSPALLAVLACMALLAGCGSSSSSSSSTATTSGSTTSGSTGTSSTGTSGAGKLSTAAVEKCKRGVNVLPTLPQKTKSRLEAICEKAASGDAATGRAAAREGCEEIVKASPLPPSAARDQALAGCKSAEKAAKK